MNIKQTTYDSNEVGCLDRLDALRDLACEIGDLSIIDTPEKLKKLKIEQLPLLARSIRDDIIDVCSNNGGHLASSLGAVEVAIAFHYIVLQKTKLYGMLAIRHMLIRC